MSFDSTQGASQARIRYEEPDDAPAIRKIVEAAFNSPAEAKLIDALRAAGVVTLSMVAVIGAEEIPVGGGDDVCAPLRAWGGEGAGWGGAEAGGGSWGTEEGHECDEYSGGSGRVVGGEVIGHVLVTPVVLSTEAGEERLFALGPVAVLPEHQGRGVGTQLVETCLERLRESETPGVVVVGDPEYYYRFGFIAGDRWGLRWNLQAPEGHFMALELSPGQLAGKGGVCRYRPEFNVTVSS